MYWIEKSDGQRRMRQVEMQLPIETTRVNDYWRAECDGRVAFGDTEDDAAAACGEMVRAEIQAAIDRDPDRASLIVRMLTGEQQN